MSLESNKVFSVVIVVWHMMRALNSDVNQKWKVVLYIQKKQAVMGSWKGVLFLLGGWKEANKSWTQKASMLPSVTQGLAIDSYEWREKYEMDMRIGKWYVRSLFGLS